MRVAIGVLVVRDETDVDRMEDGRDLYSVLTAFRDNIAVLYEILL